MTNTRFTGTYQFEEIDRFDGGRRLPPSYNRYALLLKLKGELEFNVAVSNIRGKIAVDCDKIFADGDFIEDLHRKTVDNFKSGGVDRLIREIIIGAIKQFKDSKDSKLAKTEYDELISSVTKYTVELNVKSKDL